MMKLQGEDGHVINVVLRPSDLQRRLKQNCEELSSVLESDYLPYLKPQTIARIQAIIGRK